MKDRSLMVTSETASHKKGGTETIAYVHNAADERSVGRAGSAPEHAQQTSNSRKGEKR